MIAKPAPTHRHRRLRGISGLLATCLLAGLLAGCGTSVPHDGEMPTANALDGAGETTITFWHSMNSATGQVMDKLINEFNAQNKGKIKVEAVYQGDYDTMVSKYKAAVQSHDTPSMVMIYDVGTQFMVDSGQVRPIQDFLDRDSYNPGLEPAIAGYYTVNGKLWSMPFNTSAPVLFYNKSEFAKAGLDPNNPPLTMQQIADDSKQIVSSKTANFGFVSNTYGWDIEEILASEGQDYCGPDNGRDGRATTATFDNPAATQFMSIWQGMIKDGTSMDVGVGSVGDSAAKKAFTSGTSAMMLGSIASLTSLTSGIGSDFELGVAPFPKLEANPYGPAVGGASLWIDKVGHTPQEQEACWEFIKFLVSPQAQATWSTSTGYLPVTTAALDQPSEKAWIAKNPNFQVAIDQMNNTTVNPATQGCSAGAMPQSRKTVEQAMEEVLGSNQESPSKALSAAADDVTDQLHEYETEVPR